MKRIVEAISTGVAQASIAMMVAGGALAQQQQAPATAPAQAPSPGTQEMTGQLMFFTLGAGVLIAIVLLLYFLRKRSNRAAAERVFNPNDRT